MIRVLIAEDNNDLREIFSRAFSPRIFDTHTAHDGEIALQRLNSEYYDVLVLDVNMPKVSGLDVLRHVRQNSTLDHLKVIMVTGNSEMVYETDVMQADLFLQKPVSIHELVTFTQRLTLTA